jgi:hypothetical protein
MYPKLPSEDCRCELCLAARVLIPFGIKSARREDGLTLEGEFDAYEAGSALLVACSYILAPIDDTKFEEWIGSLREERSHIHSIATYLKRDHNERSH